MDPLKLSGKTALVTGGSRGIGLSIVEKLLEAGVKVAFSSRTMDNAEKTAADLKAKGFDSVPLAANIAIASEAAELVKNAHSALGAIDILVNNAGVTKDNLIMRMSNDQWEDVISTNLNGIFYVTKEAVKIMVKQRYGRIVSISSVVGFSGNFGQTNYTASKSALIGFTKSLAKEVASRNINCNLIAPGFIETDMIKNLDPAIKSAIINNVALKRTGLPSDIAAGVLYLCSDMSNYVTGTSLHINGGLY